MIRARDYAILRRAVEEGVARGYDRAYEHQTAPPRDVVLDRIESSVLDEICEWFEFPPSDDLEG